MATIGQGRLADFDAHLKTLGIPFSGLQNSDNTSENLVIDFSVGATAEQIAQANDAKLSFDWRKRRLLTRNQIVAGYAALSSAQQNAIMRHLLAIVCRGNKNDVIDALTVAGVNLSVDEVDPT